MRKIMLNLSLFVLLASCFAADARAATDAACQAVRWPFSKDAKNFEPAALGKIARPSLFAYLYFELATQPEARIPGLAKKLFFYLSSTELNEGRANLLQVLQSTSELDSAHPLLIETSEICGIEARLPSSQKKKSKASVKPGAKK